MKIFKKVRLSGQDIHSWLVELRPHAHIPESGFAVSVILRASLAGEEDYYFAGVNVENVDHRLSTHGEEGAIAAMVAGLGNQAKIVEMWVMGAPKDVKAGDKSLYADAFAACCGKCRQQIAGLAADDAKIHYVALNGRCETTTVGDFLPQAFRLPISAEKPGRAMVGDIEQNMFRKGPLEQGEIESWLKNQQPVDFITKTPQVMVLELDNGFYVAGPKVEEAAFIDISVAQAAVAVAAAAFGSFRITGAWVYTGGKVGVRLPLSALQVLNAFVRDTALSLHYVSEGDLEKVPLANGGTTS